MSWDLVPGAFSGLPENGSKYLINVFGVLPDRVSTTQLAFSVNLIMDCCAFPTVITAPTTPFTQYEYTIGKPMIQIPLSGVYIGDNTCCSFLEQGPTIIPIPTAGLFEISPDLKVTTVLSQGADQ